jgi:hypothetical protein
MVVHRRRYLVVGMALVALAAGPACTVSTTVDDILRQVSECSSDADCASSWACRSFAMDPAQTGYCVQPCGGDDDCSFGDFCGSEGFCVQPCDVEGPDCRGEEFFCLRSNMMVGETAGYCQPAVTCATYTDCGQVFDWCIADSLGGAAPDLSFAEGHNTCVESCVVDTLCSGGFECLKKKLKQLTNINTESVPEICVPKCDQDNRCPIGYRCLADALGELNPGDPVDSPELKICVPGLPGVLLPCTGDQQCLSGLCVEDPEWAEIWDEPHRFCVEPCGGQGDCPSARFECLASEHDGSPGEFCFVRELLQPCETSADCESPEECLSWENLGYGLACTVLCEHWRDEDCGPGFVCLPTADPGQFGCYVGLPGMPCFSTSQCHQAYGEETECIGTTGGGLDTDRICTKTCTHYNQCTFGPILLNSGAPLCHQGICQPIAFDCEEPTVPYQCNDTMDCVVLYSSGRVCTIPCDGLRTTNHACPGQFTCAPLPQSGIEDVQYFCYLGFPGLMPCRDDSECLDLHGDGSQRCISPTGASLSVDGACSMPCREDVDCRGLYAGSSAELLCLPGDPDPGAGVVGYCIVNQSLDVFLEEAPGRQGTFCAQGSDICDVDHQCVDAAGTRIGVNSQYGKWFCAESCTGAAHCPQTPVAHQCLGSAGVGNGFCVPQRGADHARGFWVECYDHRQCTDGVCFQPDPLAPEAGHCTRTCSTYADPCTGYGNPDTEDTSSTCQQGVCQPMGIVVPGGG